MSKRWNQLAIKSMIDGVDRVAIEMENKWGVGRLRLLVSSELREHFDRQADLFDEAVIVNDANSIRRNGRAMHRAWLVLDSYATEHKCRPIDPTVWEVHGPDGVIALVRTDPEVHAVVREDRAVEVWTLDEVARVIAAHRDTIGRAKRVFPGAQVVDVRVRSTDQGIGDELRQEVSNESV